MCVLYVTVMEKYILFITEVNEMQVIMGHISKLTFYELF